MYCVNIFLWLGVNHNALVDPSSRHGPQLIVRQRVRLVAGVCVHKCFAHFMGPTGPQVTVGQMHRRRTQTIDWATRFEEAKSETPRRER
jgi:hypothetical protein